MGRVLLRRLPAPGPPGDPASLYDDHLTYVRASDVVGSDAPTAVTDLGGAGNDFVDVSGVTISSSVPGWPAVPLFVLDGSQTFDNEVHVPFRPMHDGTGMTMGCVLRVSSGGPEDQCIWDTAGESASFHGALMSVEKARQRIRIRLCNGSEFLLKEPSWWAADGSFTLDEPHVLVVTFSSEQSPNVRIWVDGRLVGSVSTGDRDRNGTGGALSAANPDDQLRLFRQVNNASGMVGEAGEFFVRSSAASDAERRQFEDWASYRYGITLRRASRGQILFDGNSLLDDFWRIGETNRNILFRRVLEEVGRDVLAGNRGVAGMRTSEMIPRAERHVTPNYDASRPYNVLVVWEVINDIDLGSTQEEAYASLVDYCQARRAEGWTVVVATPLPHNAASSPQLDAIEWVKSQIVANWVTFADAVARVDLDAIMGDVAQRGDTDYRYDGVHHTNAGNERCLPFFVDAIESVLP